MGSHDDVDAVDLDESGAREDAPKETAIDAAPRGRIGEALRCERETASLVERQVGGHAEDFARSSMSP
jgi:hypothetical protein